VGVETFGGYSPYETSIGGLDGRLVPNGFEGNPVGGQAVPGASSGLHNWISTTPWSPNRAANGDLAYPGYVPSGGKHMQGYGGGANFKAQMDVLSPTPLADYVDLGAIDQAIGKTGTTLYVSFLYKITGTATASSQAVMVFQERTVAPSTYSGRYEFGQSWNNPDIRAQGTVLEPANENTHLVVMSIVYNGTTTDATDQVRLWYDPVLTLPEASQTVDATATRNMTFTHLSFTGQGIAANSLTKIELDELKFGTSWGDVVPVPEPSMAAYAATGALLLVRRRKH
jgi:hypothetical protein